MIVFALDIGSRNCGWARGEPGETPVSDSLPLKKPGEPKSKALGTLLDFLEDRFVIIRPDLVAVEAPLPLRAYAKLGTSEDSVRMQFELHGVVGALCGRMRIRHEEIPVQTARKHFIGTSGYGNAQETKRFVLSRCKIFKYVPKDCVDFDRADALAIWDYAISHFASQSELKLEKKRRRA